MKDQGRRPRNPKKIKACKLCGKPLEHDDERETGRCESCAAADYSEAIDALRDEFE